MSEKVCLVGSGNWGSAIATKLGKNALTNPLFDKEVKMWVFEEYVKEEGGKWVRPARGAKPPEGKTWIDEGYRPLTEVINEKHENVIYLPGIPLPTSIVATPDIKDCVTDATMMIFVIPHNFLAPIVRAPTRAGARTAAADCALCALHAPRRMHSSCVPARCVRALCARDTAGPENGGRVRQRRRRHFADQGH